MLLTYSQTILPIFCPDLCIYIIYVYVYIYINVFMYMLAAGNRTCIFAVLGGVSWGGVGWGNNVQLHLHTMVTTRSSLALGVGQGGAFSCTCTLWWCYAVRSSLPSAITPDAMLWQYATQWQWRWEHHTVANLSRVTAETLRAMWRCKRAEDCRWFLKQVRFFRSFPMGKCRIN